MIAHYIAISRTRSFVPIRSVVSSLYSKITIPIAHIRSPIAQQRVISPVNRSLATFEINPNLM